LYSEGSIGVHEKTHSYNIRFVTTDKEILDLFFESYRRVRL